MTAAEEINERGRRAKLADLIRRKGNGHREPVALFVRDIPEPAAVGIVQAIETEGVRIAGSFVPWSGLSRVERYQPPPTALMAALVIETRKPVTDEALDAMLEGIARSLDGTPYSVEFCSTPEPTEYRADDDYSVRPEVDR